MPLRIIPINHYMPEIRVEKIVLSVIGFMKLKTIVIFTVMNVMQLNEVAYSTTKLN